MHWFLDPIKNQYADFEGRTGRQAFWMFILFSFLLNFVIGIVEGMLGTMILGLLFSLAILVPSIAITARRLHDTNKSGWWQLIALVPFIGIVILIVLCVLPGTEGDNDYGSSTNGSEGMETADSVPTAAPPTSDTSTMSDVSTPNEETKEEM